MTSLRHWDVCLSFANDERDYASSLAAVLRNLRITCFYDQDPEIQTQLWGASLPEFFTTVYEQSATCCILFVSESYRDRVWTNLERKAAISRAARERNEYVLPLRFADVELPGLPAGTGYLRASEYTTDKLAHIVATKLRVLRPAQHNQDLWVSLHEPAWPVATSLADGLSELRCQVHDKPLEAAYMEWGLPDVEGGDIRIHGCCREVVDRAGRVLITMGFGAHSTWR